MNPDKLKIVYAGTLSYPHSPLPQKLTLKKWLREWFWLYKADNIDPSTRSAYNLMEAMAHLATHAPEINIHLHLWGNIDAGYPQAILAAGLQHTVTIDGYKTKAETLALLADADILFLPLESGKDGGRPLFIPGKLFELLKLHKPILALCNDSDVKDILLQSGMARFADPYRVEDIAATLTWFWENRQDMASQFVPNEPYITTFHFRHITQRLAGIFDQVLAPAGK